MSTLRDARKALLQETAERVGRRWFATWRENLEREGRGIDGGWPGTLPEARALFSAHISSALASKKMQKLTDAELGWAMRATYDEAKKAWLSSHSRKRDEDAFA